MVERRDRWLNQPEWVEWVEEPVPGYPKRPIPRDEDAAKALKKRTLTNLYNGPGRSGWRMPTLRWTLRSPRRTAGPQISPMTTPCESCSNAIPASEQAHLGRDSPRSAAHVTTGWGSGMVGVTGSAGGEVVTRHRRQEPIREARGVGVEAVSPRSVAERERRVGSTRGCSGSEDTPVTARPQSLAGEWSRREDDGGLSASLDPGRGTMTLGA